LLGGIEHPYHFLKLDTDFSLLLGQNIDTKNPVKYGINQISQTKTLKLWKLIIAFSLFRITTPVAQTAWISIKRIARTPVKLWMSGLIPPAISNIIPVPVVSKIKPPQKKIKCQTFNLPAILSLHTPIE